MSKFILEAKNMDFTYPDGTHALRNLSIKIPSSKKIAILGNNGAGKTTLFLHFNGINRPKNGTVLYNGEKIKYNGKWLKTLRKNIGIVFQDPDNQLFSASVYQDISFGPLNLGWDEKIVREKIESSMRKTGIWALKDKPTHFLSQGQKKVVAIAGVVAMEPEVIILDEPTAGLDPAYAENMLALLDEINKTGTTVVISSHNMDEVYAWVDYIFVMHQGQIIAEGTPLEVYRNESILKKANLSKPWVLEVFEQLVALNKVSSDMTIPRNREELNNIFNLVV